MKPIRTLIIALAALLLSYPTVASPRCGDFLGSMARKPPDLEFLGCKKGKYFQLRALIATYRVKGEHASEVESYLVLNTGMARLQFVCCVWEPGGGGATQHGRLPKQLDFDSAVMMTSESETFVKLRRDWSKIPWFYVEAMILLDKP